jgi:hypothetical protein
MPRIEYVPKKFSAGSVQIIEKANEIIDEYQAQGFSLTLRQLYYQFVARGMIANKQSEYKRLGSIVNDARLAGLIDWDAIVDRTRNLVANSHWDSPADILESVRQSYRIDLWVGQKYRPEVWIEKEALIGVVETVCRDFDVPFFACRGYTSQSEQWRAGLRLERNANEDQEPIIFHFGDHDPSGIDMTRDNTDRLDLFAPDCVEIRRLALNMDQVQQYNPPPNPAKMTDSRFEGYVDKYGDESWELDALEPQVIADLIETEIRALIDWPTWDARAKMIQDDRALLGRLAEDWDKVVKFLKGTG